jgi:hypothetical protein
MCDILHVDNQISEEEARRQIQERLESRWKKYTTPDQVEHNWHASVNYTTIESVRLDEIGE